MKKYISYIMMVILCLWTFSSCNQEVIQDGGYGYLSISLDSDLSEDMVTKADDERVYAIDVLDKEGVRVAGAEDHRTVTPDNPIELKVGGPYTVVAKNGRNPNAAFDSPYYEGSTEVRIHPTNHNVADITCKLANVKFSVEFPKDFKKFKEYEVSVTNGIGDPLVFSNAPAAGNALEAGLDAKAYFAAVTDSLQWTVSLVNTDEGKWTKTVTYKDVKAGQHYHLKFAMDKNDMGDGAIVLKVTLQDWTQQPDHELLLDFSQAFGASTNPEFPAVSGSSVSVSQGDTTPKVLTFSASDGIKSLTMSHNNSALTGAGLPQSVNLSEATADQLSALSAAGVVVTSDAARTEKKNMYVDMTGLFAKLPLGSYAIDFSLVDKKGKTDTFNLVTDIVLNVDDAEAVQARTGWAMFARLEGRVNNEAKKDVVTFQYKKSSDSQWTEMDPSEMEISGQTYSAVVTGLEPSTSYVFRAVSDEDKDTKTVSFTTAAAATIHNLSFDNWYKNGDAWMPNVNKDNYIWDTANPGTSGLGYVPTTPEETTVVSGKAARLETQLAQVLFIKKLAAGNIYTGKFGKVAGVGAELNWGVPFTSRPLALRGYWKYSPKTIDNAESPYDNMKGQTDFAQVQMFLTDWNTPFLISTSDKRFVDYSSDSIIARGELHTDETHSEYVQFTIPLVYRNDKIPTHIVISGAASMYGDYFTGGVGSVLLLDEFELVYDPAELTEEEYNAVFSQVSPF